MFQFNPEKIFISVDTGKSGSKFSWLNQNHQIESDVFATLSREVSDSEATFAGDSNLLTTSDGKSFLVGGTGDYSLDNDHSKLSKTHELCVLTSVAKVISEKLSLNTSNETYNVVLSVNVPLEDFKNTTKTEYSKLYEVGKVVELKLNGNTVAFKIVALELFFESQGAIIRNQQLINTDVLVYDIGGKNDTMVLYKSGRPMPGQNDMEYNGLLTMLKHVADDLRKRYKTRFSIQSVEQMVLGTQTKVEGFDTIFDQHATEWVKRFKSQVMKLESVNTQLTTILFTGGGSLALRKHIQKEFEEYKDVQFSADGKYDNATGGLIKALNIHAK